MIVQKENMLLVGVDLEASEFTVSECLNKPALFWSAYFHGEYIPGHFIYLPEGTWQLQGTITEKEISFDVEPFVERRKIGFKDYTGDEWWLNTPQDSFRSLMQSIGAYTVNPYGEKPIYLDKIKDLPIEDMKYCKNWMEAEKTTSPKWALLTPVNN